MNKRGMTLVEILAAIAIMAIISVLVVPSVISIRNETLEDEYYTRVQSIKNAGIEWANDNLNLIPKEIKTPYTNQTTLDSECAHPTVGYLIESGYLLGSTATGESDADVGKVMYNPITGESMNGLLVCIRFDTNDLLTRKLVAYIVEE